MVIFLNFSPTSNHLHPLQVENCDSNSRLVVDGDDMVNMSLKGLKQWPSYLVRQISMTNKSVMTFFVNKISVCLSGTVFQIIWL